LAIGDFHYSLRGNGHESNRLDSS